ncbi:MAG: hypothetical protein DI565_02665 [Ancylobacter novellus]|uniref:Thoeris protein ThsB TIR-like domain-containing protein n=1 Tax=Ancylobacter novellus TaxID=921 RepID=A0A2W5KQC5_ANCNO|nr:MAG: hypothetical protein DI565_02665 [Ancylobacter novellus]
MALTRMFISFDYDHDAFLKEALVGQSKLPDSPFTLADWSIKEHIDGNWREKARTRIRSVDVVCVICGQHTDTATGVGIELKLAQEEGKPYFLLHGYASKPALKPTTATPSDKVYNWTWDNLKILVKGGR